MIANKFLNNSIPNTYLLIYVLYVKFQDDFLVKNMAAGFRHVSRTTILIHNFKNNGHINPKLDMRLDNDLIYLNH